MSQYRREELEKIRKHILGTTGFNPEAHTDCKPEDDAGSETRGSQAFRTAEIILSEARVDDQGGIQDPSPTCDDAGDVTRTFRSNFWETNVIKLEESFDLRCGDSYMKALEQFEYAVGTSVRVRALIQLMDDEKSIWTIFRRSGENVSPRDWEEIALYLLQNEPARAIDFLELCLPIFKTTLRIRARQATRYLVAYWYHQTDHPSRVAKLDKLAELAPHSTGDDGLAESRSNAMAYRLMHGCSPAAVKQLFAWMTRNSGMHWHTWLQYSTYCIQNGDFELALDAILQARGSRARLEQLSFTMTFSALLRAASTQPDGLRIGMRFYDYISRCGMPLTTTVCNVLMMNAADAGDVQTTLAIHKSMLENGPKPDEYSYAALLRAWKHNIDDASLLKDVIRMAIEASVVTERPYISTEILHCLATHHRKKNPTAAYKIVADAYLELFDLAPLQQLGLLRDRSQSENRQAPNGAALGIMFKAFFHHLLANRLPKIRAQLLYVRWRELMFKGEMPFALLAENTYIYGQFLYFFTRAEGGIMLASQIIKDMQAGPPKGFAYKHAKPCVFCWSIYLFGFVRAGKMKLAEQILVYMREKGVEPTIDVQNHLLSGYAGRQSISSTLDKLKEIEDSGEMWNEWTLKALSKHREQDRLRNAYEKLSIGKRTQELPRPETATKEVAESQTSNNLDSGSSATSLPAGQGSDQQRGSSEIPVHRSDDAHHETPSN
jgi:pentatricopeptide repeat protein